MLHDKIVLCSMIARYVFMSILLFAGVGASAQKVTLPDLFSMVELPLYKIDTLMKKNAFELSEKEFDSLASLYYYTSVERNEAAPEAPTWVRSVTVKEASVGNLSSRVISYRTYNSQEYRELMAYLLANQFKSTSTIDYTNSKHTVYENGRQSVVVKITDNRLKNGKILKGYEIEVY